MVSRYDRPQDKIIHLAVNSCLAPVCSVHGLAVTTIEGIGSTKTKLHPVQERIAKAHGSQCGFCTPGIVMSMYTLLRNMEKPSMHDIEVAFQGNLCRCTGYRPILEGYRSFVEDWEALRNGSISNDINGATTNGNECGLGKDCCKYRKDEDEVLFDKSEFTPYDPTQEPIFPPGLKLDSRLDEQSLHFRGKDVEWYRPTDLETLLRLKQKHPNAKIIVGNTEVGVEVKFKHFQYPILIQPSRVQELNEIKYLQDGIQFGAAVTLQDIESVLRKEIRNLGEVNTKIFKAIIEMLNWFAGKQIRNVAALGGNIMTGSPISDLNPILMAADVILNVASFSGGYRQIKMNQNFFTGYRRNIIKPDEILLSIRIPYTTDNEHFYAYKQARRREDDIAIVNAAFSVILTPGTNVVEKFSCAFGGMAPTTVMGLRAAEKLPGMEWDSELLETGYACLMEDLPLSPEAPGGMIQYRRSLTLSFFLRLFLQISQDLNIEVHSRNLSALSGLKTKELKSSQYFQVKGFDQRLNDPVGRPIVHVSAYKQASGEAIYCDDIPRFENELYIAFVLSTKPHATITAIDATEALAIEGVQGFFSAKDLEPSSNAIGTIIHDEEVFVSRKVTAQGQIIAAIVADDQLIAQKAARKVKVGYEELEPVIITIEDAIKHKSYHLDGEPKIIEVGNVDEVFKGASHIIEGETRTGEQEHFYFETQAVIVVPKKEDDEIDIYCSTQHPTEISKLVAHVLQLPQNKVITKVKRMGGGFGGKESKAVTTSIPVAVVAHKMGRPVRMMLDRDEDILLTGGRHPFYMKYKVAFDDDGKIIAYDSVLYCNAGYSLDLSAAVMDRAMFHVNNSYHIPNLRVKGYVCKTNIHSNTAFRGFGGPQGMFCCEAMIRDVAEYLNKDAAEISYINLYKEGQRTHYSNIVENCTLQQCWKECIRSSDYDNRKAKIEEYNAKNRYKKRGISIVPTMFGISFSIPFLNQAGALVNVYTDGSVLITHAGTEMGQGLHTKMIQIASRVFEIDVSKIHISETATDKVPNTSPTAASASSDLNGMAVMIACETIKKRLQPIIEKNPKGKWEDWVRMAWMERISLSSTGHYATPNINYNPVTNTGSPFSYFTFGVAVTEVEIDSLTGDHQVLRTDIVMDLGESLNPAIDIGQIEGAFMQGYGLFMLEEIVYSPKGDIFTKGPGAYKIPGFGDIPAEFIVSILKAFFAAREAIKASRKDAGYSKVPFKLDAPCTSAKIRMACQDEITNKFANPNPNSFTPWNVIP
ncbi:xanthine dehydrogenase [Holotrichia oblita]|uniref:Xanthine dehydrogenase n=1 Tax=Holotrichia oblita TaxID=644536 RepID=A0ACB9T5T1_HOLOL|nr:xanthine dehydrogenase [Holotrichia oblita]